MKYSAESSGVYAGKIPIKREASFGVLNPLRGNESEIGVDMPLEKDLLDILACPKCKQKVLLNEQENGLICEACGLLYDIKDNIPIMIIEEAKPLN